MLLQQERQCHGSFELWRYLQSIKFIMNPKTDKYHIELQSLYHIIDINMANFAGVNYIINIYGNAH